MTTIESRQPLIDAANARMCARKTAALEAYERVHPVGHARCTDACREAHRELLVALSDVNHLYSDAIRESR